MGDGVAKVARRLQEAKETGKLGLLAESSASNLRPLKGRNLLQIVVYPV